jgi:Fe-Mn family superoxide dismutase
MTFELPPLPFAKNALAPYISEETLEYHYGKHHKAYVDNLNKLIANTPFANKSLEEIIMTSDGGIFNNAAQVWNHTFYWNCLAPDSNSMPKAILAEKINEAFGSFDKFRERFTQTAISTFGSGWAWLVKQKDGSLDIVSTSNAQTPMTNHQTALLTCDVWEHAYYIDYRNARPKYVEQFWEIVNWDFVASQFEK